jgi:5-methyltetrahydrofolate--homocysteine methyltransferase
MTHAAPTSKRQLIEHLLQQRILVLDGAMGTMVQSLELTERDVRGARFAAHPKSLKNFIDLLCLTRPDAILQIHRQYLAAGADIIETNTFGSSPVAMQDFELEHVARELNLAAVRCARQAADEFTRRTPERPRFVAGSIGPPARQRRFRRASKTPATGRSPSISWSPRTTSKCRPWSRGASTCCSRKRPSTP